MTRPSIDSDSQAFLLNDLRLRGFVDALRAHKKRSIRLSDIWVAFRNTYRDLPDGPQRRAWLLAVLEALAGTGELKLPVPHGTLWDRTSQVALPALIKLPVTVEPSVGFDWRNFPWHPRLQWVLESRYVSPGDTQFLQKVNQGLAEGWFQEREPFKYRSLQLTGDEKRLVRLCRGSLFGEGKLNLEILGCEEEILPMAIATISAEPLMLVFENAAPFMLARRVLSQLGGSRVGCVGYGAGTQVIKSIGYFPTINPTVSEILYVGDLDAEGLQIASDVKKKSNNVPIRPATSFHLSMFESAAILGSPEGWEIKDDQPPDVSDSIFEFLDPKIRSRARHLVQAGRRIPEEVISHSAMRRLVQEI